MSDIILNSGGMDSFFVAMMNPKMPHLFVKIGHAYQEKELESAKRIADFVGAKLHIMEGAQIGGREHESGIIPLRNAELILCAGQYANNIYLGILENEVNSDKSPEFLRSMETMMTISCRPQYWSEGRSFRIHTPLGRSSKAQLVGRLYKECSDSEDFGPFRAMKETISCYSGKSDRHCGRCPSCFKRWVALTVGTGIDYGRYFDQHPAEWYSLQHWQEKGYAAGRIKEIEQAYAIAGY